MKSFPLTNRWRVRLTESVTMAHVFLQRVRTRLSRYRHPAVWSCSGRKQWIEVLLRLSITLRLMADSVDLRFASPQIRLGRILYFCSLRRLRHPKGLTRS